MEQELQLKRAQRFAEAQHVTEAELENMRQSSVVGRKKPPKISPINKTPASPSNNSPMSPTDVKAKNTGLYVSVVQHHETYSCSATWAWLNTKDTLFPVKFVNINMKIEYVRELCGNCAG